MTLPDERYRSVMWAKRFLEGIAYDYKAYPRISKAVRGEAHSILRHFPSEYDMKETTNKIPEIFATDMEPLYRMVKAYEQDKENE
jgi:hypothetical protein